VRVPDLGTADKPPSVINFAEEPVMLSLSSQVISVDTERRKSLSDTALERIERARALACRFCEDNEHASVVPEGVNRVTEANPVECSGRYKHPEHGEIDPLIALHRLAKELVHVMRIGRVEQPRGRGTDRLEGDELHGEKRFGVGDAPEVEHVASLGIGSAEAEDIICPIMVAFCIDRRPPRRTAFFRYKIVDLFLT
jgi:hypothetical protein